MGNAIQTMSAAQIEAAFNRDLYLVTFEHEGSGYFTETMFADASLGALVDALWQAHVDARRVLTVTMMNREQKVCRKADHEVASVIASRSRRLEKSPNEALQGWLDELGVPFFHDREYLAQQSEQAFFGRSDDRRDRAKAA